ncbi:RusA family crossover junction endodeoxyribonuclease [bacterium]|nr:RusA family crossover junction endodeoxyribonuclease [bacterium]
MFACVIFGEPASKANSRRLVQLGNRLASIKSKKALAYADAFAWQCPVLPELLQGDVQVEMKIWYASRRPDLDESLILDLLQGRAYVNDRQVKRKVIEWAGIDKANPRTWIRVTPLVVGADP